MREVIKKTQEPFFCVWSTTAKQVMSHHPSLGLAMRAAEILAAEKEGEFIIMKPVSSISTQITHSTTITNFEE